MPWAVAGAAVASIGGALISSSSNKGAADTAAAGQTQAAQITADANAAALDKQLAFNQKAQDEYRAASARGLSDIDAGLTTYTNTVKPLLTPAPITLPTYRGLTTQQQTGEKDLLRNANATMAASGLRGAGRAGVGAVLDQDRRYEEDARAANNTADLSARQAAQGVANSTRVGLAGSQLSTGGSKANTELLTGNQLGGSLSQSGQQASALTQATGSAAANAAATGSGYQAQAELANGKVAGSTLGSLAGTFSSPYITGGGNPNVPGYANSNNDYVDAGTFSA